MSGINGDKSRFHRQRKQKVAQRQRTREWLAGLAEQPKPVAAAAAAKPKTASV
jgi:hypothetical protein